MVMRIVIVIIDEDGDGDDEDVMMVMMTMMVMIYLPAWEVSSCHRSPHEQCLRISEEVRPPLNL